MSAISPTISQNKLAKALRQRLQSFHQNIPAFKKALLEDENLELISEVLDTNYIIGEEFVQCVREFYRFHGKEESLIQWAIQKEIADTDNSTELFRMQSFATQLVFNIFFGDRGKNYLLNTVAVTVRSILSSKPEKLELVPNGITVSVEESQQNFDSLIKLIRNFFSLVELKSYLLPRVLRRAFIGMKQAAQSKFPEIEHTVVPVFFFLRCLCPVLTQPDRFGITVEKPDANTLAALVLISKIVQNIANGIIKNNINTFGPQNKLLLDFIEESIDIVRKICEKLSDVSLLVSPLRLETQYSQEQKDDSFGKITKLFLSGDLYQQLEQTEFKLNLKEQNVKNSKDELHQYLKTMEEYAAETEWKNFKESANLTGFLSRSNPFIFKLSGSLLAPCREVFLVVKKIPGHTWFDILRDKCAVAEKCIIISEENHHNDERWSLKLKLPFPYVSKRVTVEKSILELSNHQFSVIIKPLPDSAVQFGLTIHFNNLDDVTKYEVIYKLSYSTSFHLTQPSILNFGKDLFRCFERFNNYIGGAKLKSAKKKTSLLLTSSANTPKSRPKSRSMRKLLSVNKSDSTDETPSESSTTASTTTSNSIGKSSSHIKSYSSGNVQKKIRSPNSTTTTTPNTTITINNNNNNINNNCETQRSIISTNSTSFITYHQINRSVSDDNFGELIRNSGNISDQSPGGSSGKSVNSDPDFRSLCQTSVPQLSSLVTSTQGKQVTMPIPSQRRYSDIKLSPIPAITFKKSQPLLIPKQRKVKHLQLLEHSEEVSLISEEEATKRDNNSRSSEDSSPDLLSLSD